MSDLPLANCGIWSDAARQLLCQIFHFQTMPQCFLSSDMWGLGGVGQGGQEGVTQHCFVLSVTTLVTEHCTQNQNDGMMIPGITALKMKQLICIFSTLHNKSLTAPFKQTRIVHKPAHMP